MSRCLCNVATSAQVEKALGIAPHKNKKSGSRGPGPHPSPPSMAGSHHSKSGLRHRRGSITQKQQPQQMLKSASGRHVWGNIKDALHHAAHVVEQPVKDALHHAAHAVHHRGRKHGQGMSQSSSQQQLQGMDAQVRRALVGQRSAPSWCMLEQPGSCMVRHSAEQRRDAREFTLHLHARLGWGILHLGGLTMTFAIPLLPDSSPTTFRSCRLAGLK